jgi:hypothetical protein
VVGLSLFRTLAEALETPGLCAVSRLIAARIAQTLQSGIAYIRAELSAGAALLHLPPISYFPSARFEKGCYLLQCGTTCRCFLSLGGSCLIIRMATSQKVQSHSCSQS